MGRLLAQDPSLDPQVAAARLGIPLADPNRLNNLTILYAELATSDTVLRRMRRDGPIRGSDHRRRRCSCRTGAIRSP